MTVIQIIFCILLVFIPILIAVIVPLEVVPKIAYMRMLKEFADMPIYAKWVLDCDYTNPYEDDRYIVYITDKKFGTDGKTPWVSYKKPTDDSVSCRRYESFRKSFKRIQ